MKILIADDQPMIVEDLLDELSTLRPNAMCLGTSNPSEIVSLFKQYSFDIVFLDIDLAGFNGIKIAKIILEIKHRTNIIYITGYEKFALESYKTVASAFLVKPISTEMLTQALKTLRFPVSDITDELLHAQYSGKNIFGAKLTKYREESGMNPQELADAINVAVQTVYRWERGERIPDIITFMHIARVLGITAEKLICF
ncbi:MAG: response regulator [Acutalibacteraceae bacterium]|nr:response regulator [Acutalibacteraceae bacterium]